MTNQSPTPIPDGPLAALRDQLVDAARRQATHSEPPSRRSWPRPVRLATAAAIAAGLLIAGLIIAGVLGRSTPAAADVHVERRGDVVTVTIERDASPTQIEDALARAGVKVTVRAQRTGPSRLNRFVGISGPASAKLVGGDGVAANIATFLVDSNVELSVGVAAPAGQLYEVPTDPTAPGEPLAGRTVTAQTVGSLRPTFEAKRLLIDYRDATGIPTISAPDNAIIAGVQRVSDRRLLVFLR